MLGHSSFKLAIEAEKPSCDCNLGTNKELVDLILKSPLLPVIERFHNETKLDDKSKSRIDVQVTDYLLNQILTGKYSILKEKIQIDKVAKNDKYFNGLDIKKILLGATDAYGN